MIIWKNVRNKFQCLEFACWVARFSIVVKFQIFAKKRKNGRLLTLYLTRLIPQTCNIKLFTDVIHFMVK
jgi:hypothetical protein